MKTKTIQKTINSKIESWMNSIVEHAKTMPEPLKTKYCKLAEGIKTNYIVTGGCIVSMLQQQEPNDFDVYFINAEFVKEIAEYYVEKIGSAQDCKVEIQDDGGVKIIVKSSGIIRATDAQKKKKKKNDFIPLSITDNAITLSDGVQFILRFTGSPEEIHKNFDFAHTKCYQTSKGIVLDPFALECILTKTLKYTGSLYPVSSIIRARKFVRRGWTISAGELLKIMYDVSKLDLDDVGVLKEQLIGVDVTYFYQFIKALIEKQDKFDRGYLFELIDAIFDEQIDEDHFDREEEEEN